MQFLNILLVAAVVSAQSLPEIVSQIPSCALTCLATGAAAAGMNSLLSYYFLINQ
jgi:hypothetical protein